MGKRSDFKRRKHDKYMTPMDGVLYLERFLPLNGVTFIEPCAANGGLVEKLESRGAICKLACDIEPEVDWVVKADALEVDYADIEADYIITNPPWTRSILHDMIVKFSDAKPTWLLFDANWLNTAQARLYKDRLVAYSPTARLCWIEGTNQTGKDDTAWYLFDRPDPDRKPMIWLHEPEFTTRPRGRKSKS